MSCRNARSVRIGLVCIAFGVSLALMPVGGLAWADGYKTMTAATLKALLPQKEFFLLDVHIPEQRHIPGTDAFIDFREIKQNAERLPIDKSTRIIVY